MGLVQTIRNWISAWRGRGTPSATVDFWNSDRFMLKDLHGLSDELRLRIDELIKANKGLESGLFNKRWVLPIEALDPLRQLFPDAKIAPAVTELNERTGEQRARFALSSAKLLDELPYQLNNFGIEMYPFQHAAVAYLLRAKQCVLGDEAGVGKTFPAIAAACLVREPDSRIIVICPANLKLNWASEIKRDTGWRLDHPQLRHRHLLGRDAAHGQVECRDLGRGAQLQEPLSPTFGGVGTLQCRSHRASRIALA